MTCSLLAALYSRTAARAAPHRRSRLAAHDAERRRVPTVLSIAGSDSGGGAGIQADLKAFARCGVHGMTAITAITAQNTVGVEAVEAVPPEMIVAQVRAVADDIGVDAVKIGMLGTAETVEAVVEALGLLDDAPVVVDPVMVAESGAVLLDDEAREALVERLLPLATVATPNLPEARALTGRARTRPRRSWRGRCSRSGPTRSSSPAATATRSSTSSSTASETVEIAGERHPDGAAHGSGCTHSSALAAFLARGDDPAGGRAQRPRGRLGGGRRRAARTSAPGPGPVDVFELSRRAARTCLSRFRAMSTNGNTATSLPRPRSAAVFDGPDRAHARAYMKGIGFDDDALSRPTIGIANTWTEAMPCNFHLRGLAEHVKDGVRAAGGTPMEFNTVAVSDGITMGTQGMKASLVSREVIADSIELMARGYQFDAIVALCACDKTIPGCAMALARLDIPSVMLYGGSIAPGHWHGRDVTILDIFEAIGAHAAGDMTDEELNELEGVASPGAGACGGQFTANTMACAFEALGICAGGSAMVPAEDDEKGDRRRADRRAGDATSSPTTSARAR